MKKREIRDKTVYMRMNAKSRQHILDGDWQPFCQSTFPRGWENRAQYAETQFHNPLCKSCVYVEARARGVGKSAAKKMSST